MEFLFEKLFVEFVFSNWFSFDVILSSMLFDDVFTFEIVEQCDSNQLTEREKYWTDFYKAQEFGYSIRKG